MNVSLSKTPRRSFFRSALGLVAIPFVGKGKGAEVGRYTSEGQPIPISGLISHLNIAGRWFTAIYRKWSPGDELNCRLCDRCHAVDGNCLITIPRFIPKGEAKLYSSVGKIRPDEPIDPVSQEIARAVSVLGLPKDWFRRKT